MRAIEYHEELGHMRESAARYRAKGFPGKAAVVDRRAAVYEARIADKLEDESIPQRAETGCPPFIPNALLPGSPPFWRFPVLCYGVPDAKRVYRSPGMRAFYEANPELLDRKVAAIDREALTDLILRDDAAFLCQGAGS